jgi:8-oxo-dGDP phosphatase
MSADQYQVLDSHVAFRGRIITLRTDELRMSDGSVATREIVEHPGAVAVVAIDESDRVVTVNQFRLPIGAYLDELPAGLLDVDGESALDGAQRELFEEAALRADEWHVLVDLYTSPGFSTEAIRIFLARGLSPVAVDDRYVASDEEITLTVSRVPLDIMVEQALAGELNNAAAVAGVLAAAQARTLGWRPLRPADVAWPARPDR